MALRTNSAEGGSNGTGVTTGNSGGASGDAWDVVLLDGASTIVFSNTQVMHGALAYAVSPASAQNCYLRWNPTAAATGAFRYYLYLTGSPSAASQLVFLPTAAGGQVIQLRINTNRTLFLTSSAGATHAGSTFTNPVPLNTWTRIELKFNRTASTVDIAMYPGDSTTATEEKNNTAVSMGATNIGSVRVGRGNTGTITTFYMDDLAYEDGRTTYLGPATVPATDTTLTGTLPTLGGSYTATSQSVTSFAGGLPGLQGGLTLASATDIALAGNLAALSGSLDAVAAAEIELAGLLPGLVGQLALSSTAEITLAGQLPALIGSASLSAGAAVALTGQLPALIGSASLAADANVALTGVLPALVGSFELDTGLAGILLNGVLPTLTGSLLAMSESEIAAQGSLPVLTGDFTITVISEATLTLGGQLPALDGSFNLDSGDVPSAVDRPIQELAEARPQDGLAMVRPLMELAEPRPLK